MWICYNHENQAEGCETVQYKNDLWYKTGICLIAASATVMSVTFVLMGFGVDGAIIWFFAACPFLVAGFWMIQSIRRKYEKAEITGRKREPMFAFFLDIYNKIYTAVSEKGAAKTVLTAVLSLGLAAVLVCGWLSIYYRYCNNGILKDPKYKELCNKYEICEVEWNYLYNSGYEDAAHDYYVSSGMAGISTDISKFEKLKNEYMRKMKKSDNALVVSLMVEGTLAVMSLTALSVVNDRKKRSAKEGGEG